MGFRLPNLSGDHRGGKVRITPVNPTDIPNKKYVDDVAADIIPQLDDTYDLGSQARRWAEIWAVFFFALAMTIGGIYLYSSGGTLFINASTYINGSLNVSDSATFAGETWLIDTTNLGNSNLARAGFINEVATDTNPVILPTQNDDNTGIGRQGADNLVFIAGGINAMNITEISNLINVYVQGNFTAMFLYGDGSKLTGISAGGTSFWINDTSGVIRQAANSVNITGNLTVKDQILIADGTEAKPSLVFAGDTDTGWYLKNPGNPTFSLAGTDVFSILSTKKIAMELLGTPNGVNIGGLGDAGTGLSWTALWKLEIAARGDPFITMDHTSNGNRKLIINQNSNNIDFRIESDNEEYMFFIDGATNKIGVKESTPLFTLDINGNISIQKLPGGSDGCTVKWNATTGALYC